MKFIIFIFCMYSNYVFADENTKIFECQNWKNQTSDFKNKDHRGWTESYVCKKNTSYSIVKTITFGPSFDSYMNSSFALFRKNERFYLSQEKMKILKRPIEDADFISLRTERIKNGTWYE